MATSNRHFRLKLAPSTSYNFTIFWGDGSSEIYNNTTPSNEDLAGLTHTYTSPAIYKITIYENVYGGFPQVYFNGTNNTSLSNDDVKILDIIQWGDINWTSFSDAFEGCSNLSSVATDGGISLLSGVGNFLEAWRDCTNIRNFPLIDTSNGINFEGAWSNCNNLRSFQPINVSKGTNFKTAWYQCSSLVSFPQLTTLSGTNFEGAWSNCYNLTSFPLLSTSNGENFISTWSNCVRLSSFPLINTSKGTNFTNTWYNCNSLRTFPLINTLSAQNMTQAWAFCNSLTSFPLINTSRVTDFVGTWLECQNITQFPSITTSSGTNFMSAWAGCNKLTTFPLICTLSGTNFRSTWFKCSSLSAFPLINTSNGTNFISTWANCINLSASDFPTLNMSKMLSGANCFAGVKLTTSSYSALLTSLCATNFNNNVQFNGGNSQRNAAGTTAFRHLTAVRNWSIVDNGIEVFNPASVGGLDLWLDANVGLYDAIAGGSLVTTNGAKITRWEDRSGNNFHAFQTTDIRKPTLKTNAYNGKPSVSFVDQFMTLGDILDIESNKGLYVFALVKLDANREQFIIAKNVGNINSTSGLYFVARRTTATGFQQNQIQGRMHSNGQMYIESPAFINSSTNFNIWAAMWPRMPLPQIAKLRFNKVDVISVTLKDEGRSFPSSAETLIGRSQQNNVNMYGEICELLIYRPSTPLTTTQIENIENYLTTKWS